MDYRNEIAEALASVTDIETAELAAMLEQPPQPELGDYALPCFRLAKALRKAPPAIAADIAERITQPSCVSRIETAGGYLNFFINKADFAASVINRIRKEGNNWGGSEVGAGKTVCIDFSSINIAKPFHIGHLPTTVIGNSLYKIYSFLGYNVVRINHLGDWGTQFGKLITAYKLWGNREEIERESIDGLLKIYVRFHAEAETNPALDDEARAWFKAIEDGNPEALELFNWFKELTLKEVGKIYEQLGVEFDSYAGESFYNDKMGRVVDELRVKELLTLSDGAYIVDLAYKEMPPCLILKSDGATLYATRDIAAALYRKDTYNFAKCLYVVAYQQTLHFRQIFEVLRRMGYDWAQDCEHVAFGMVSMEDGSMSTRKGKVVFLQQLLERAVEKTLDIINEKSPELPDKANVARQVGIGAVIFNALFAGRIKDYTFTWERALNFDGESGPYCQYTHARCCSVLAKAGGMIQGDIDATQLSDEYSSDVLRVLAAFPDAVAAAQERNEPSVVTRYAADLAKVFNKFYYEQRILDAEPALRAARIALTDAVRQTMANALGLIGVAAPEKM